jgi:hypothetical protein
MDGTEDDLRMLCVRGWRQTAMDRREWKNVLSGQGPKWAVQLVAAVAAPAAGGGFEH